MPHPFNENGEPIMTHSQWMQECAIDEQDRYDDMDDTEERLNER